MAEQSGGSSALAKGIRARRGAGVRLAVIKCARRSGTHRALSGMPCTPFGCSPPASCMPGSRLAAERHRGSCPWPEDPDTTQKCFLGSTRSCTDLKLQAQNV